MTKLTQIMKKLKRTMPILQLTTTTTTITTTTITTTTITITTITITTITITTMTMIKLMTKLMMKLKEVPLKSSRVHQPK